MIVKSSVVAGVVFIIVCLAALGVWGIDSDGDSVPDSSIQSETVGSVGVHVSVTETEDEVAAYGLYVDGVFVAACPTDEETFRRRNDTETRNAEMVGLVC